MTEIDQFRIEVRERLDRIEDMIADHESVKDYAARMSISERTIRRYISEGKIEVKRIGKLIRIKI